METLMRYFPHLDLPLESAFKLLLPLGVISITYSLLSYARQPRPTRLKGPPSPSYLLGVTNELFAAHDQGAMYENWEKEYGAVYAVPAALRSNIVILCDPKAVAHCLSKDTFVYQQQAITKLFIGTYFGHNILWAEGETHKRQRRALSSAFSNTAIRKLTSVFYDSVHMLKASWESSFQNSTEDSLIIDVQQWMDRVSLDSIGTGGFSYNFGTLQGKPSPIADAFSSLGAVKPSFAVKLSFLLAPMLPMLATLPNKRNAVFGRISDCLREIAIELLDRARAEKTADTAEGDTDKSIIGTLIRSENASSSVHLSLDEIMAQNVLILAGYETTAMTLTWALIELSRNPDIQERLRKELRDFSIEDPTYDQLMHNLPYLDGVTYEVLRLHPAGPETTRTAQEDDMIPLTQPIQTASGESVNSVFVTKGTTVRIPIACLNTSEHLWGEDAKQFRPERWLNNGGVGDQAAAEIRGHRHLMTFIDGPRACLGKGFALTELKVVLSILIRNFSFELPDGPTTKIERHRSILTRPKIAGQDGPHVPLVVKRLE